MSKKFIFEAILCLFLTSEITACANKTLPSISGAGAGAAITATEGEVEANKAISFTVTLAPNNKDALAKHIQDSYDPKSPNFGKFYTSAEFQANHGATPSQVTQLAKYFQSKKINITPLENSNKLLFHATGAASQINQAFKTKMLYYKDSINGVYFGPSGPLNLPNNLNIETVYGINNTSIKTIAKLPHKSTVRAPISFVNKGSNLTPQVSNLTPQTPNTSDNNVALTAAQIRSIYGLTANLDGQGQSVGILASCTFSMSDILKYTEWNNFPEPQITVVPVNGGAPNCTDLDAIGEAAADIELVLALAPKAHIYVYQFPNIPGTNNSFSLQPSDVIDVFHQMANDADTNHLYVISSSIMFNAGLVDTLSGIFQQMVSQGQSFLQCSGDHASSSYAFPSDDPNVTSVGGTSLVLNSDNTYQSESVWYFPGSTNGGWGSGGGVSTSFTLPTYQQGVKNLASAQMRNFPDVALYSQNSGPTYGIGGYNVYFAGDWRVFDGTSAATPVWAGLNALVNQQRQMKGLGNLGFLNPYLYSIAQSSSYTNNFHPTLSGSNGKYSASSTPSYNNATGWGSPKMDNLIAILSSVQAIPSTPSAGPPIAPTPVNPGVPPIPENPGVVVPKTPNNPAMVPATPSNPALVPATPSNPALVPATPSNPALVPATPSNPALVPATPSNPALVPATPSNPAVIPATPATMVASIQCTSGVYIWNSGNTGYPPNTTVKDPNGWACYWNGTSGNSFNRAEPINGNGWIRNAACPTNDNCTGTIPTLTSTRCSSGVYVWNSGNSGYPPNTTVKDPNGWACYWNGPNGNNFNTGEPIQGNGWMRNASCPTDDTCQ